MISQFAQPILGKTVRVTTRFPDHYYWAQSPWRDTTYEGVVGRADRSVPNGSFMLLTPQDSRMPTRVISLERVIALEYADGTSVQKQAVSNEVHVWQVKGSKDNVYTVTQHGAVKSCTCPGYTFRKTCKHVQ